MIRTNAEICAATGSDGRLIAYDSSTRRPMRTYSRSELIRSARSVVSPRIDLRRLHSFRVSQAHRLDAEAEKRAPDCRQRTKLNRRSHGDPDSPC